MLEWGKSPMEVWNKIRPYVDGLSQHAQLSRGEHHTLTFVSPPLAQNLPADQELLGAMVSSAGLEPATSC
jgi:hypothetical protein